ncbi:MAG: DUF1552 domain-containing protein [Myxococcota bacterium]|nr:DUF1552 domain-containing protein [Myxococcota bacterium]
MITRRGFLFGLGGAAAALPFAGVRALGDAGGAARRVIIFYFPDGVPGRSQDGDASLWGARAEGGGVRLGECLEPLRGIERECVFLGGLTMGGADEGSHPGGAKKLLTGVDGGHAESIDRSLARTAGASSPHPHLYLGAMANVSGASGDKHISYLGPGHTVPPEDDPRRAFARLFRGAAPVDPGSGGWDPRRSILDVSRAELEALSTGLGERERGKLDLHLEALREVESRLMAPSEPPPASCEMPAARFHGVEDGRLHEPERFGDILRAQIDVMVTAMACGQTRVGVIQGSHHTSELIMSRIAGSEMHDPGFDMRSHQASHYGARHDRGNRLFTDFVAQRRWWVARFRDLLEALRARPEGDGTMLDHSLVLLCSEVSDGNTHSHADMPFVLAGRAGGCVSTGRVLEHPGRRHAELLLALGHAMGQRWDSYGDAGWEPLPGLLS